MASTIRQRLTSYLSPIEPLKYAIWALYTTCWNAIRTRGLGAFSEAGKWRDEAFALWYRTLNAHFVRMESGSAVPHLVASAEGVVLELGPGLGNQIPSFDQTKIRHIYGVELNEFLIPDLHAKVTECGLDGKYTVIHSGVEDTDTLEAHGILPGSIDTILSIQTFCSFSQPEAVAKELYKLLKPGGKLIFWEHSLSHDFVTRRVDDLWNIPWNFLVGGCNRNRDTLRIIKSAGPWENLDAIEENRGEPHWRMMPRFWGVLVKPQ
ncbi:S-adenosyl-L-methionine-dependent methyltransferase [Hypomontagnella submonticulosa]|nr:S-adenosyl-L-methionine-dependent methyltransferase [Hypomontagnella submonticulosa]